MIDTKKAMREAQMYVFELNACAREFGFKSDEGWELSTASVDDKKSIEKRYHPVMSVKVLPEILPEVFTQVNDSLSQIGSGINNAMQAGKPSPDLQYLVAFNPKRPIR